MTSNSEARKRSEEAHDNGDCVCCLPDEMVEFESAKQTTIPVDTIRTTNRKEK